MTTSSSPTRPPAPDVPPSPAPHAPRAGEPGAGEPGAPVAIRPAARPAWLGRALAEGALIAFGVMLGFAVTEWGSRRAARQRAAQALDAIAVELDSNRVVVQRARLQQREKADTLARYVASGAPVPGRVFLYGMFNPARVQSTAWEAARQGDALRELPYALVVQLGRLYEGQLQYRALSDRLIADMYTDFRRDGVARHFGSNPAAWEMLNRDFADRAGTLEAAYARTAAAVRRARRGM